MSIVAHPTFLLPSYTFDLSPWLGALNTRAPHSITIELRGATGASWLVASTLLLWRAPGLPRITALRGPTALPLQSLLELPIASTCIGKDLTSANAAGSCSLSLGPRTLRVESTLLIDAQEWEASVEYGVESYESLIDFNNTSGYASWRQATSGVRASWRLVHPAPTSTTAERHQERAAPRRLASSGQRGRPLARRARTAAGSRMGAVLTLNSRRFDWLNVGGIAAGQLYELSFNTTLLEPTVFAPLLALANNSSSSEPARPAVATTGRQHHYQRALMVDVYGTLVPQPPPPGAALHTASLNSTVTRNQGGTGRRGSGRLPICVTWEAVTGFGASKLMTNDLQQDRAAFECDANLPPPS
jgi:hypothetical protein